jgi:hypothetical protein
MNSTARTQSWGYESIGIKSERLKNPKRIFEKFNMNMGKKLLGDHVNFNHILFIHRAILQDGTSPTNNGNYRLLSFPLTGED